MEIDDWRSPPLRAGNRIDDWRLMIEEAPHVARTEESVAGPVPDLVRYALRTARINLQSPIAQKAPESGRCALGRGGALESYGNGSGRSSLNDRKKRGEDLRTRRKYSASIARVLQGGSAAKATSGFIADRKGATAARCVARPSAIGQERSSMAVGPRRRRSWTAPG